MDFLFIDGVTPFTTALLVLFGLVVVEVLLLLVGTEFFGLVDDLLPDFDAEMDAETGLSFGKAFYFVGFGKVPFLMVLMSFLASFGLSGCLLQSAASQLFGSILPISIAAPVAVVAGLLLTSRITALLAHVMPSDQTTAVSEKSFLGCEALVTYGTATSKLPATAEVIDQYGRTHHIQLKAVAEGESFREGESAIIVRLNDGFFLGKSKN